MIDLIYCADGNPRFAEIAIRHGFTYGAQIPNKVYFPIEFADQDWKDPQREEYVAALAEHRPRMATVLDLERESQLPEVLSWAEDAAQYVDIVIIIPKVFSIIGRLPREIGGARVHLGYSVPTKFGGTQVPVWEFAGWPVHLLGGSPHAQMRLVPYLDVRSADGNMIQKLATRWCMFWVPGNARYASNRWWPTLKEANNGELWNDGGGDAIYEAFERSCRNVMREWRRLHVRHSVSAGDRVG